jgi:hypothetical protein
VGEEIRFQLTPYPRRIRATAFILCRMKPLRPRARGCVPDGADHRFIRTARKNTMSILSLFEGFGIDLAAEAAKVGGELVQLGEQEAQTAVADFEQLFRAGVPFALAAIRDEAPKVISGQEKFGSACTTVAQKLEAQFGAVVYADVQSIVQSTWNGLTKIAAGA